jgi:hypothetical protein
MSRYKQKLIVYLKKAKINSILGWRVIYLLLQDYRSRKMTYWDSGRVYI